MACRESRKSHQRGQYCLNMISSELLQSLIMKVWIERVCWMWMENVGCGWKCWMWMRMLDVGENVGRWTWMKMLEMDENVGCEWGWLKKPLQLLDNWSFFWISMQCFSFCSPSRFEQVQLVDRSVPRRSTWAEKHIIGLVRQLSVRLSYPQWCS